jgi:tetratricopeptide (TPR) repeat protein
MSVDRLDEMKQGKISGKIKNLTAKKKLFLLGSVAFFLGLVTVLWVRPGLMKEVPLEGEEEAFVSLLDKAEAGGRTQRPGVSGKVVDAFESIHSKVVDIQVMTADNHRLRLENMNLRRWAETLRFECAQDDAIRKTGDFSKALSYQTGSDVGRILASIPYRPPPHLLPAQLYTLGVSYFRAREYEKSAVIFTYLTGGVEHDAFQKPQNFLLTGITWYELDNYRLAKNFLDRVLEFPATQENLPYHAQARLWQALVAKQMGQNLESQIWLRELIDHHPRSLETQWINATESDRLPSSQPSQRPSQRRGGR